MSERDIVDRLATYDIGSNAPFHARTLAKEAAAEILRLRAKLTDARRAGWIAGRDAAAEIVEKHHIVHLGRGGTELALRKDGNRDGLSYAIAIRQLEPPA